MLLPLLLLAATLPHDLRLRDQWHVRRVAPAHCTGEPAFKTLAGAFGSAYLYAGVGKRLRVDE